MNVDLFGNEIKQSLKEKYIIPPFSVIDLNKIEYKKRARKYIDLGIKGELGRNSVVYDASSSKDKDKIEQLQKGWSDGAKAFRKKLIGNSTGISVFNPFICEIVYRWFCPNNGFIFDPFCGGSTRGIVAKYLDYNYEGIDIREEQIISNYNQINNIFKNTNNIKYHVGDSDSIIDNISNNYDLIFTCPPYFNLEVYSDKKDDLSTMDYQQFIFKYESILKKSFKLLKDESYFAIVLSDVRRKNDDGYYGSYIGLIKDTINIFEKNGMRLWNDIVIINSFGNAGIRADRYMKSHKVVRVHQNLLVFKKTNK
jgi:DNA modification methylase